MQKKKQKTKSKITRIKPMLAALTDQAFDSAEFIFEIKWDGYRALAGVSQGQVDLYSRNFKSFNDKYPSIVEVLKKVKEQVIFDGEIVAYNQAGSPSFQALQNLGTENNTKIEYVIFDILYLNGKDLTNEAQVERKEILREILIKYPLLTYGDYIENSGIKFFNLAAERNLEGIIAKRRDSKYIPGFRSDNWLKIKNHKTDEGIIVGFTEPRGSRARFGALVLGQYRNNDELTFIGHTGTGFTDRTLNDLYHKMKPLITEKSPFKTKIPLNSPITWIKPKLVAQLKFTEWTASNHMRHPVFLGLREDKKAKEIYGEKIHKLK
jgi:bifunctional non-homologous end joining protein LigD